MLQEVSVTHTGVTHSQGGGVTSAVLLGPHPRSGSPAGPTVTTLNPRTLEEHVKATLLTGQVSAPAPRDPRKATFTGAVWPV